MKELAEIYKDDSLCGFPYQKKHGVSNQRQTNTLYDSLIRDFEGKYSKYDLVNDGQNYDITIDELISTPSTFQSFIQDKDLKCEL